LGQEVLSISGSLFHCSISDILSFPSTKITMLYSQESKSGDPNDFTITIEDASPENSLDSSIKKGSLISYTLEETPEPSVHEQPKPAKPGLFTRISGFVHEWTPFLLVTSYFIFSTCLYLICTERLVAVFWFIYMATNFYIATATVMEAFLCIGPNREARRAIQKAKDSKWLLPTPDKDLKTLDLVMVAYLPNEKDIIMDRALYALEKIVYPRDKIRINIVYNTPKPIEPLETELYDLMKVYDHLRVIKVPNSTSKADNLNYFFSLNTDCDVIAIYDTDHYPHPHGPRWAMERFSQDSEVDIVQGRCIVFNSRDSFLTSLISVEFDKIYAVSHPGRATMWGFGLFCGSNGYWKADLLRSLKMDGDMLTEDIDSALRAVSQGAKTVHELNATSYELAPTTFAAFWKQRLRWAQGWCQASMKHLKLAWTKPAERPRDFRTRVGIISLLLIREWSYYLVTQYTCLVLSFIITRFPRSGSDLFYLLFFQYPIAWWLFFIR
jgi:cellulose synthase/poly-beta-1,6-N-acetylglucosamine synthase-like glycosyltransferase